MADSKISELTAITGANTADDDLLVIVDTSASQTKKITLGELENALAERDFNFGDNDKLTFGAGSDLQIYHDGNNSFIDENGVGNLFIRSVNGASTRIYSGGTASSNLRLLANSGGEITLYHSGSAKLATTSTGIDVTGTVTADTANISGSVTVGNDLTITDNLQFVDSGATTRTIMDLSSTDDIRISTGTSSGARSIYMMTEGQNALRVHAGGDISFYEDTGTTAKFFWDASAESLGIGTTSPTNGKIEISNSTDGYESIRVNDSRATPSVNKRTIDLRYTGTNGRTASNTQMLYLYDSNASSTQPFIQVDGSSSTHLVLDSSGNVGIGTSSPSSLLHVSSAGSTVLNVEATGANDSRVRITAGSSNISYVEFADPDDVDTGEIRYEHATNNMQFRVSGNSEAMRIDSSGNLLVGQSTYSVNNGGIRLRQDGEANFSRSGQPTIFLNRVSSDGEIARFTKDGTTVGSIGAFNGDLSVGTGDTALRFHDGGNRIEPFNVSTNANTDGAVDLGVTGARFKDLYLSGGVYLGGTGAANKLDDVESGSWTPIYQNTGGTHTYDLQQGHYYKVGPQVFASFRISAASTSGWNTALNIQIGGLPFVQDATIDGLQNRGTFEAIYFTIDSNTNYDLAGTANSTYLLIRKNSSGGANVNANYSDMTSQTSCQIRGLFIYRTSA